MALDVPIRRVVVVKLGGAAITDKRSSRKIDAPGLRACASVVREATARGETLIVAHGAGSFGHGARSLARSARRARGCAMV